MAAWVIICFLDANAKVIDSIIMPHAPEVEFKTPPKTAHLLLKVFDVVAA